MDYYDLRKLVAGLVPRTIPLIDVKEKSSLYKKKRKSNYKQYNLVQNNWESIERLLNTSEINSFLEVSCRAAACPMPLNIDVWDGTVCPYGCKYCYANLFKSSLYSFFFDNSKSLGIRHCRPDMYKKEMDKVMKYRHKNPHDLSSPVAKSIAMGIPIRFGIRFEDFLKQEKEHGISLQLLQYLKDLKYPVMVNTKSDLIGTEPYVRALAENKAGSAVHITLISSNNELLKKLEPGAPSYNDRIKAMKNLSKAGVRVVARIEPYLVFATDKKEEVLKYQHDIKDAGVKHLTFDTYSYTANSNHVRTVFRNCGIDWDRLFLLGCDSQAIGSLLLGKFMDLFKDKGFKCSSFDMGNVPTNNQSVCCEVGDLFGDGYNYGSSVMATRFIMKRKRLSTTWKDFEEYVNKKGGFLSEALKIEVRNMWNGHGSLSAYGVQWAAGLTPIGYDGDMIWCYDKKSDFRMDVLKGCLGCQEI